MTTTIAEAVRDAAERLRPIADNPRHEARMLLAHALGLTETQVITNAQARIDPAALEQLLVRRLAHEPMHLILGHRHFWTLDLLVSPATLIPRPDSETLIHVARTLAQGSVDRILDLGTGTGCLLLALLQTFPRAFGVGVDLVPAAAALAQANAARNGLQDRSTFLAGSWTGAIDGQFDIVVSNPPYIPAADIPGLMPDVSRYEPRSALDGGPDGLNAYRAIIPRLPLVLAQKGLALLELGVGQGHVVSSMAQNAGFSASLHPDLAGIERVLALKWPD